MSLTISFVLEFHMVQKVCNPHLCNVPREFLIPSTVSDDEQTSGTSSTDPSQERGLAFGWSLVSVLSSGSADYWCSCISISNRERIPLPSTYLGQQRQVITLSWYLIHWLLISFSFIFGKNDSTPGFDPIIGANAGKSRFSSGIDPVDATRDITMNIG